MFADIIAEPCRVNMIGFKGENSAREVCFPIVKKWKRALGEGGSFKLLFRKAGENETEEQIITEDDEKVMWLITSENTDTAGEGIAQLSYIINGRIAKTERYTIVVGESL